MISKASCQRKVLLAMPEWHCRLASASAAPRPCEGPQHRRCGLRYLPGEYALGQDGITLPGIGTVRMEGMAFVPQGAPVITYQDGGVWVAEFAESGYKPSEQIGSSAVIRQVRQEEKEDRGKS